MSSGVFTLHAADGKLPHGLATCGVSERRLRCAWRGWAWAWRSIQSRLRSPELGGEGTAASATRMLTRSGTFANLKVGGWSAAGLQGRGQHDGHPPPLLSAPPGICVSAVTARRLVGKRGPAPVHRLTQPLLTHGCEDAPATASPPRLGSSGN